MPRTLPLRMTRAMLKLIACGLVLSHAGFSQSAKIAWQQTRAKLADLKACIGPSFALGDLEHGLTLGWAKDSEANGHLHSQQKPTPPPPEYLASLDQDIKACYLAKRLGDGKQSKDILNTVIKDIQIKSEDCHKFGMSRMVPVNVTTLRGAKAENGWQVFYKWLIASPFQPEEVRAPNLTSPANVELPPGVYSVRAEKRVSDTQVETVAPVRVVVGSTPSVPLQLSIH